MKTKCTMRYYVDDGNVYFDARDVRLILLEAADKNPIYAPAFAKLATVFKAAETVAIEEQKCLTP